MAFRFVAATNKKISQIIKQAVPKIYEEGEETRFEVLTGKALSVSLEFIDEIGEKGFVYKCKLSLSLALLYLGYMFINKL